MLKVDPELLPGVFLRGEPAERGESAELEALFDALEVQFIRTIDPELGLYLVTVKEGVGFVRDEDLRRLNARPAVELAERNQVFRGATEDDDWPFQWNLDNRDTPDQNFCDLPDGRTDIDVEGAWAAGARGEGVVVAVVDSGVGAVEDLEDRPGPSHPDLRNRYWRNPSEEAGKDQEDDDRNGYRDDLWGWDFVDDDNFPQDLHGHGTMVASVLGAEADNGPAIAGVAPEATLMHLRFLDADIRGDLETAVKAIEYAGEQGARIVNMSWTGCEHSQHLEEAIRRWPDLVFVAAAGNDGKSLRRCPVYPAASSLNGELPNLVSVMGVRCDRRRRHDSNFRADLAAPGDSVVAFDHHGDRLTKSGTSLAAPHVSGVAALLLSREPGLTASDVVARLKCSADSSDTAGLKVGAGIVNAAAAVLDDC